MERNASFGSGVHRAGVGLVDELGFQPSERHAGAGDAARRRADLAHPAKRALSGDLSGRSHHHGDMSEPETAASSDPLVRAATDLAEFLRGYGE